MRLAEHLFRRLREVGVDCTFGVPGDFVLPLYAAQAQSGMRTVVCTHEPNAAFAADAYARMRGLGVVLVTYGAGALNAVNPVAMSYAEHTPLLVLSGAPETTRRGPEIYLHHMVKSFESQLLIFKEVTVTAVALTSAETAAAEIDRVISSVMFRRRPGYLEIPRDLVNALIPGSDDVLRPFHEDTTVNAAALNEAIAEVVGRLENAVRPVLYVGVGVRRYGLTENVVRFAERWNLPVVSSVMGKASFPESHPQFIGVYMGAMGDQNARTLLENSDCVLSLGVIHSDVNAGMGTSKLDEHNQIDVDENSIRVGHHRYHDMPISQVIRALECRVFSKAKNPMIEPCLYSAPPAAMQRGVDDPLCTAGVIELLRELDQSKYSFLADVGDAWFMGLELRADVFLAPGYYATMGFAVPGAVGAGIADPRRRPLVLVGDGAFQMTGTELATLLNQGLSPIILLLNNSCYMMLEALDAPHDYYDLKSWNYVKFAESLGCRAERATTHGMLRAAFARAEAATGPYLIEAVIDKKDLSPVMQRIQAHVQERLRIDLSVKGNCNRDFAGDTPQ